MNPTQSFRKGPRQTPLWTIEDGTGPVHTDSWKTRKAERGKEREETVRGGEYRKGKKRTGRGRDQDDEGFFGPKGE